MGLCACVYVVCVCLRNRTQRIKKHIGPRQFLTQFFSESMFRIIGLLLGSVLRAHASMVCTCCSAFSCTYTRPTVLSFRSHNVACDTVPVCQASSTATYAYTLSSIHSPHTGAYALLYTYPNKTRRALQSKGLETLPADTFLKSAQTLKTVYAVAVVVGSLFSI